MTDQLELLPDGTLGAGVRLTNRQRIALDHIAANGPILSSQLGAFLHQERRDRGGRGHGVDVRCGYCEDEGKQMGAALRAKGLVRYQRGAGWYIPGPKHHEPPSLQIQAGDDWPDNFF